jgi:hypothetical protein
MKGISIEQLAPDYLSSLGATDQQRFSSGVFGQATTEAPVLFERRGIYYALFDHTCCVCSYGSGVQVYTASTPLGNYSYRGQVGRTEKGDPVTHAQQAWILQLPLPNHTTSIAQGGEQQDQQYIWIGDRWGSAPDGLHGHDFSYWQLLEFDEQGDILQFDWKDGVEVVLP